jgi:putative DNA primase/helicase
MNAPQQVLATPHPLQWLKGTRLSLSRGDSSNLAAVAGYSESTLAVFLHAQIVTPRLGRMSAGEYAAADKPARDADKAAFGWFSHAAYSGQHRNKDNWQGSNIVVFDADATCGDQHGPEYSFDGEELRQRLSGLWFIALPTHSWTDSVPRWRILIPLSDATTHRDEYKDIAQELAGLLDGYVDPRSFTPEQLWYNLSAPAGEWENRKRLIMVSTTDSGQPFDVAAWRIRETERAATIDPHQPGPALLPPPPLPETSENIERVRKMLDAIDPDPGATGTRDRWMRCVWSVASLFWTCGKELAEAWSQSGNKWDATEFEKVWNSYKADGRITIGTLHHFATESGWVDSRDADRDGDLLNAQLFAKQMAGKLLFNHTRKKWHQYDGARWMQCEKGEEMQAARHVVGKIIELAAKRIAAMQTGDPKRKDWNRHLLRSQQLTAIEAMLKLAQSEVAIATRQDELDSDPWLLGCMNGVVDLHTGTLLAHDPAMKITRIARAHYDPAARCPNWIAFLTRIFSGDMETIAAIKRMVGYSLLGVLMEEVFLFAFGNGANGKSVFFNVLGTVLADYAIVVPAATLMVKRDGEGSTNDIARMAGARFAVANETKTGDKLDDQKLKQLASRDRIAARYLYGEYFEFDPSATVWVRGNHKPIVTDDSDGLWRRLVLIPFAATIPEAERDPQLTDKLLCEADGILTWAVEGCLDYQHDGLKPSAAMKRASAEYRKETDILGEWLETCCEIAPEEKVDQGTAYQNYRTFCSLNGVHPMSKKIFSRKLDERNLSGNAYIGKTRAYAGFKLRGGQ